MAKYEPPMRPAPFAAAGEQAHHRLETIFGDRLSRSPVVCEQHAGLEGHHDVVAPEAVVFPATTEEVAALVGWCGTHRVPLIPHGAGTSLEGHLSAIAGGISVDLSRLDCIIEVSTDNLLCTVQAGVTREALNHYLRDYGLTFPIDPGANATLGGMAATRASGTNAVRYGTMRSNVLSVKAVMADGSVVETGTHAAKSAAGYDLTGLLVGSEGTLGIITELTLRLYGIPESILSGTCVFANLEGAVRAVIETIQIGIPVARIELLDACQIAACNAYSRLAMPVMPTLFMEFHGSETGVAEQVALFGAIAAGHGRAPLELATSTEDRSRLWKARHHALFATKALIPGARVWTTDVCVPIATLADSITAVRADIDAAGLQATIVGHVGDGNYHVMFVLDPACPDHVVKAAEVNERMITRAIAEGGTCTGEHGIGIGKRDSLVRERGSQAISVMRLIRDALDPQGILNPGKIF